MKTRCFGGTDDHSLYAQYHDQEWGEPQHDDQRLFEVLCLESLQAGLRWSIVLQKRQAFNMAFHHFNPQKVVKMTNEELDVLATRPELIRSKPKTYAIRDNARIFQKIQKEHGSFNAFIWFFVNGTAIINHWVKKEEVPAMTPLSETLSTTLKQKGMCFIGPTIMYAYM